MIFRHIALLDKCFTSDVSELNIAHGNQTVRIRKISVDELTNFLLPKKTREYFPQVRGEFETAITIGEESYWIDYCYDIDESPQAIVEAFNASDEEIEKLILGLRLLREGCLRAIFRYKQAQSQTVFDRVTVSHSSERPYVLNSEDVTALNDFLNTSMNIAWQKRDSRTPFGIALSRFTYGYERLRLEDKIIDYMIGLETLYHDNGETGEVGYKLAHRASILLSDTKEKRRQLFEKIKESYRLRSKIVHGGRYKLSYENAWFVEDLLRDSIKRFLNNPKPDWLNLIF
jgi:hypothetical protein